MIKTEPVGAWLARDGVGAVSDGLPAMSLRVRAPPSYPSHARYTPAHFSHDAWPVTPTPPTDSHQVVDKPADANAPRRSTAIATQIPGAGPGGSGR